jgi:hypothetical protein
VTTIVVALCCHALTAHCQGENHAPLPPLSIVSLPCLSLIPLRSLCLTSLQLLYPLFCVTTIYLPPLYLLFLSPSPVSLTFTALLLISLLSLFSPPLDSFVLFLSLHIIFFPLDLFCQSPMYIFFSLRSISFRPPLRLFCPSPMYLMFVSPLYLLFRPLCSANFLPLHTSFSSPLSLLRSHQFNLEIRTAILSCG